MKNVYGVQAHDKLTRNGCQNLNKNSRPEKSLTYENKITEIRYYTLLNKQFQSCRIYFC